MTDGDPVNNKITVLEEIIDREEIQGNGKKTLNVNYEITLDDINLEGNPEILEISNNKILR